VTSRRNLVRGGGVLAVTFAAGLVGGCASAVPVDPATHATDPDCASLILATPDRLGDGLDRRRTTAQATTAWGNPAIVLRCGIEPPGPTTERCETVTTPDGPSVDWLVVQDDQDAWTFTTYGRVPAVEVLVPAAVAAERSTAFLDGLGPAIAAHTEQQRGCL
jgi:hypothetical protein